MSTIPRSRIVRRTFGLAAITVVGALALSACAAGQETAEAPADDVKIVQGGVLNIGIGADPASLDPALASTLSSISVFTSLCEGLYSTNRDNELQPALAAALPVFSDDGTSATVALREDALFQDGTSFDAAAVKAGIERNKTLEGSTRAGELAQVASVEVVDEHTVEFIGAAPLNLDTLGGALSSRAGIIVSPTAAAEAGEDFGAAPVCVGPFAFESRVPQDSITLVKSDTYYDADEVNFDEVVYKVIPDSTVRLTNLRSGDLDVIEQLAPTDFAAVEQDSALQTVDFPGAGYFNIVLNTNVDAFSDQRVRQAFEQSIDREALVKTVYSDLYLPGCSFLPPSNALANSDTEQCNEYDPDAAKKLLADAGIQTPIAVNLLLSNRQDWVRAAQMIQAMGEETGFEITIEALESTAQVQRYFAGEYDLALGQWAGGYDPTGNISFVKTNSFNSGGYTNPEIDELVQQIRQTTDDAERSGLYAEVAKIIKRDVPGIYWAYPTQLLAQSDKVAQLDFRITGAVDPTRGGFVG